MNFNLQGFLLFVALISFWVASIMSKSTYMVEFAVNLSTLLIFITLPLAICDGKVERRPFWIGFFTIGTLQLFWLRFTQAYSWLGSLVAKAICGDPQTIIAQTFAAPTVGSPVFPTGIQQPAFLPPAPPFTAPAPFAGYIAPSLPQMEMYSSIESGTQVLAALLVSLAAAYLTLWFSQKSKDQKAAD